MILKGLYLDDNPVNAPYGTWSAGRNMLIKDGFQAVTNEGGFDLEIDFGLPILHAINVNVGYVVFLTDNRRSAITFVDNEGNFSSAYSTDTTVLQFSFKYPIEAIYKINNLGHIIVAWTDNNLEPRILDITQAIADGGTAVTLSLFPENYPAFITETTLDSGGSLLSGAYFITCKKITKYGTETQWEIPRQPIHITDDNQSVGHNLYDGCPAGTITNKSISLDIVHGNDGTFNKLKVGVITKINGVLGFYNQGEYDISSGTDVTVVVSDLSNSEVLDISEALVNTPVYLKAKTLETLNDNLYLANLNTESRIDYQKYANNITLGYKIYVQPVCSFPHSSKLQGFNHDNKTFMPREVYNFYIFFYLKKGGLSEFYHIPGRALVSGDRAVSSFTNTGFSTNPLKYEVEDTCTSINYDVPTGLGKGLLGKFENKNQVYGAEMEVWDAGGQIGTLEGEKVRFHRFPSSRFVAQSIAGVPSGYGKDYKEVFGLTWEDVYIPDEIKEQITGYGFAYAKRDTNDMTIYGNDYLQYLSRETNGWEFSSGVNNAFNGASFDYTILPQYVGSHCLDLLKSKLAISPNAIIHEYSLYYNINGTVNLKPDIPNTSNVIDFTDIISGAGDVTTIINSTSSNTLKEITDYQYIPNDIKTTVIGLDLLHYNKEEFILFKVTNSNNILPGNTDLIPGGGANDINMVDTSSAYYSILGLKTDIYQDYKELTNFCLSDTFVDKDETDSNSFTLDGEAIWFGDCFTCMASHIAHNFVRDNTYPSTSTNMRAAGVHYIVYNYVLISANNWGLRHRLLDNSLTCYYPKDYSGINTTVNPGYYQWLNEYNSDYSSLNDLLVGTAYDVNNIAQSSFPYRIAIGQNKGSDSDFSINWASFLANDVYDMLERNKGEIWKIIKYKEHLLIHQKYSLFIALLKDKLITSVEQIFLGTGDIFDRKPGEVIFDTQGYAGNQSQWASIVCKLGYCFCDRSTGKVFIFDGTLKEISNSGIRRFLRDNLQTTFGYTYLASNYSDLGDIDVPQFYNGVLMTYDELNNRLILSKKSLIPSFGYSATFDETANYSNGLYFWYKGGFYKVTAGSPTGFYLTSTGLTAATKYLALVDWNDTNLFINNSFTISYSPIINEGRGAWAFFHDYYPNIMFYTRTRNYIARNGLDGANMYKMNSTTKVGTYVDGTVYKSFIDLNINNNPELSKISNSVSWDSNVYALDDVYKKILEDETLTHIMVYNDNQCSDVISLVQNPYVQKNVRNVKEQWFFNEFRDRVINRNSAFLDNNKQVISANLSSTKAWFNKNLFIGKFIVVRLQYDNVVQRKIDINDINVNMKKA